MKTRQTQTRPPEALERSEASRSVPAMGRGVGIFVSMVVASAAGLLGLAVWTGDPQPVGTPRDGMVFGAWRVL